MLTPLSWWGTLGIGLTMAGLLQRRMSGKPVLRPFIWLLPMGLLCGWVLLSSFNPSFTVTSFYEQLVFRPVQHFAWLPSSIVPIQSRAECWLYAGLYCTGFNLALNLSHRSGIQKILVITSVNAGLIAVFGTLQKLVGSDIFFGLQHSPNLSFFGSFIYHNHWGPYALMHIAMLLGLVESLSRKDRGRGFWHSPAVAVLLAAMLLGAAIPLSTSRSSTVMLVLLLGWGLTHSGIRLRQANQHRGTNSNLPMIGLGVGTATVLGFIYLVSGDTIRSRMSDTVSQLTDKSERTYADDRLHLYQDTIMFISQKPWTGWGLDSYSVVWRRENTRPLSTDGPITRYKNAHSDWLQILTEVGIIGGTLLLAVIVVPLWQMRRRIGNDPLANYTLLGAAMIALYAAVEFPFDNPAVTLTFWVGLFVSMRLLQLSPSKTPRSTHE